MKLNKQNVENILNLTSTQEGILFQYLMQDNYLHYFEQTSIEIDGNIDLDIIKKSWQQVVQYNEMLRTSFKWQQLKKPIQVVWKSHEIQLDYIDISGLKGDEQHGKVVEIKLEDKKAGFDLHLVPFRIKVIRLKPENFLLIISNHSILLDGWSFNVVLEEFFDVYQRIATQLPLGNRTKTQFKDYFRVIKSYQVKGQQEYWAEYLRGFEFHELPFKEKNKQDVDTNYVVHKLIISEIQTNQIKALSKKYSFSMASFFYAAWGILLQKLNNECDVTFGTTFSGRSLPLQGIEHAVGNFLNTFPIRLKCNDNDKIVSLIQALGRDINTIQQYIHSFLVQIKEYANIDQQEALFDSLIIFENHPINSSIFNKNDFFQIKGYEFEHVSNYALTIFIIKSDNNFELHFSYQKELFKPESISIITSSLERVIAQILNDENVPVGAISLLSKDESNKILYSFNQTSYTYDKNISLKELLENQFQHHHDRVAVQCNGNKATYLELNHNANNLAWCLTDYYGPTKTCVGLIVDRSIDMIISVIAVIKAGYIYVPIDPTLPPARINKMIDSLSLKCIITTEAISEKTLNVAKDSLCVETIFCLSDSGKTVEHLGLDGRKIITLYRTNNLPTLDRADSVAYIIFTSGSTGMPKGVVVQHRPVINIVEWINNKFSICADDKILCVASLSFDLSVYDIFGILAKGATICIATFEDLISPETLNLLLKREKITIWNSAPPLFQNLLQWYEFNGFSTVSEHLRLVMLSGDWIGLTTPAKTKKFFNQSKIVSLGGATEATIWSNYYVIEEVDPVWKSIPYGKPIQNCTYYILDRNLNPCPIGVKGDLYIGGECLALGYVNSVTLTSQKFIPNPFLLGTRMYATGDVAQWYNDGNIELLGRKDSQVKIRGYRVELGEIENYLLQIEGIKEALVISGKKQTGDIYICAYLIAVNECNSEEIKRVLATSLPAYMVPAYIIQVDTYPTTANGKIDRNRLQNPTIVEIGTQSKAPQHPIQRYLVSLWSEILNIPQSKIGLDANFFELGGHSLNITELTSRISTKYNINIQLRDVYQAQSLEKLAEEIISNIYASRKLINKAERKEYYQLTSSQLRMYALQESDKETITYNIAGGVWIKGALDVDKIRVALTQLIGLHECFRTSFQLINGDVRQVIDESSSFTIDYKEVHLTELDKEISQFIRPFSLDKAPLVRAVLFGIDCMNFCLVIDMHHIVADGYSLKQLIKMLGQMYAGEVPAIPSLQYKDYAEYVNRQSYQLLLEPQKRYWHNKLSNFITRLNLPLDFERSTQLDFNGDKVRFTLNENVCNALKKLASEQQATLFTVVFTLFNLLLAKICNEKDLIIGTPVIGRNNHSLDNTMGMFVNILILKNKYKGEESFILFLESVKKSLSEAIIHADVPFETLAQSLDSNRSKERNPIFDVLFEYDNLGLRNLQLTGLEVRTIDNLIKRAKFDLTLEVVEFSNRLECSFEYRTALFKRDTIEWLTEIFITLTNLVIGNPTLKMEEISIHSFKRPTLPPAEIIFNF